MTNTEMTTATDNFKSAFDVLTANSVRPKGSDEIHAPTAWTLVQWINDNQPLLEDESSNKTYQIDTTSKVRARKGLIEAMQSNKLEVTHPVFKTNLEFLKSEKLLNLSAHKHTCYHKIRTGAPEINAVTAGPPVFEEHPNLSAEEIIMNANARSAAVSKKIEDKKAKIEELKTRAISSSSDRERDPKLFVTFSQMMEGISAAIKPISETMVTIESSITVLNNKPMATFDAATLKEIVEEVCKSDTIKNRIAATCAPSTTKAITEANKAVTATKSFESKMTGLEARILALETAPSSNGGKKVDESSNEALIRAYSEFNRGCKEYSSQVEGRCRMGICQITLLNGSYQKMSGGVNGPDFDEVSVAIGCAFTGIGNPYKSKSDNWIFTIKLLQPTPAATKRKFDEVLENRKVHKGKMAVTATPPPQHKIDATLIIWKTNKIICNFDTTKKGHYIIHLNDGDQSFLNSGSTVPINKADLYSYQETCSRLNVFNARELAGLEAPSITTLRKIIRKTHFYLNNQVIINPKWNVVRPTLSKPFLSAHFIDGSDDGSS